MVHGGSDIERASFGQKVFEEPSDGSGIEHRAAQRQGGGQIERVGAILPCPVIAEAVMVALRVEAELAHLLALRGKVQGMAHG